MPKAVETSSTYITGRRAFGAALLAIGAGSGITAGAAAGVADFAEQPDADLIAACQHALSTVEKQTALTLPFEDLDPNSAYYRVHADAAYEVARNLSTTDYHPSIATAASLPAQSRSGLQAKARLLLQSLDADNDGDALAASLVRDVLAWSA